MSIVDDMRVHLKRLRYLELQEAHHEAEAIVHHEDILAALQARDVRGTTSRLRAHLKMLEEFRERLFRAHGDVFA
ncbi:protein of unknown function [Rhodovastum atsumiense]|nr:FCD domain-containing protein [Rhodovastum atsumiense]CAH2603589.1 protein of unknown function [Rhodovastum atsumiense]